MVERESTKGPLFLLPATRIANLEFKLAFFEGQLDPLQFENMDLRDTVIHLLRSLSSTPTHTQSTQPSSADSSPPTTPPSASRSTWPAFRR